MAVDQAPDPRVTLDGVLAHDLRSILETSLERRKAVVGSPEWARLVLEEKELAGRFIRRLKPTH